MDIQVKKVLVDIQESRDLVEYLDSVAKAASQEFPDIRDLKVQVVIRVLLAFQDLAEFRDIPVLLDLAEYQAIRERRE